MIRQHVRNAALVAALGLGSTAAFATPNTFDFSTVPTGTGVPLDSGANTVTVNMTTGGATATFSDPNSSGDFFFLPTSQAAIAGLTGPGPTVLSDSGGNGTPISDELDITFSQGLNGFGFSFGLGNISFHGSGSTPNIVDPADSLSVALYDVSGNLITTDVITTNNFVDTGVFEYNGSAVVGKLALTAITSAAESAAGNVATVNLAPAVPEPDTYALMGLGLLAVAGIARRRGKTVA